MTIDDIIDGRPLTDPRVVREVLRDTIPGPGRGQDLVFLLCDLNGHLLAPVFLPDTTPPRDPVDVRTLLDSVLGPLERTGSAACAVVRHGPIHALEADREWQETVQRYSHEHHVRDLGFYVVGTRGTAHLLPLDIAAA